MEQILADAKCFDKVTVVAGIRSRQWTQSDLLSPTDGSRTLLARAYSSASRRAPRGNPLGELAKFREKHSPRRSHHSLTNLSLPISSIRHQRPRSPSIQPAAATETQLTQELIETAWRLNRIPLLEAQLFSQSPNPESLIPQLATLDQVEAFSRRLILLNESRHIEHVRFYMQPPARAASAV